MVQFLLAVVLENELSRCLQQKWAGIREPSGSSFILCGGSCVSPVCAAGSSANSMTVYPFLHQEGC